MKRLLLLFLQTFFMPAILWGAVKFDGTGDGENITDPNVPATVWSACGWFKTATFTDGETIFYYGNGPDAAAGRGIALEETNNDASTGKIKLSMFNGTPAYTIITPMLNINTWYHICWVGQGTPNSQVYVDATDAASDGNNDTDAFVAQNSTDDFNIGQAMPARTGAGANDSDDYVEQFGVWNIALTGAQVASMADKSTCPTAVQAANLKFFFPLLVHGSGNTTDSNAWAYTESGNPTDDAGPGGLPCAGGGGGTAVEASLKAMGYH